MKEIPGFPNYQINQSGTTIKNIVTGISVTIGDQIIKGKTTGYKFATLCSPMYEWKRIPVHRLVAITYVPNPDNLPEVNHKDRIRDNNNDWNLEWTTHADNIRHSYENGRTQPKGKDSKLFGRAASAEAKKAMSESKIGELHPKFKGWYMKDSIKYGSAIQAGKATGISNKSVERYASSGKHGWTFIPKDLPNNYNLVLELTNEPLPAPEKETELKSDPSPECDLNPTE